jgi:hypothetical protein
LFLGPQPGSSNARCTSITSSVGFAATSPP